MQTSRGKIKVLNLYAGIGGNRKLWTDVDVTAVEYDEKIAAYYQKLFPNDTVIVADAHQYLLDHFAEFDFIWSSPPCPTHSKINIANVVTPYKDNTRQMKRGGWIKPRYPKMELYQEIIFLKHFFKGKWVVENVVSYYDPLIPPIKFSGHYFWSNFWFSGDLKFGVKLNDTPKGLAKRKGFDYDSLKGLDRELVTRNAVYPEIGLHILQQAGYKTSHPPIQKQGALL